MAKTAQILLLLLVTVAVQSYGGRRYFRGRSPGRSRNPNDYYHHRRHAEDERPHEMKHYANRHYQKNSHNPGDQPAVHSPRWRNPAEPDDIPLAGSNHHNEDLESTSTTEQPPLVDTVPNNNSSPDDDMNADSDESVSNPGVDLTGAVINDKPDDVSNIIENGKTPDLDEPDHNGNNINEDEPSSGGNPDGTINVNGMSPMGSNEQPEGDGSTNGLSLGGNEDKTNPGEPDNNLDGNIVSNLDGNVDGDTDGNLDSNLDGKIGGNLPTIHLDKPTGTINVNGLEPGGDDGSSSIEPPNSDYDDGYLNNHEMLPDDKDKPGHDDNNIDNGELLPNGDDGNINVNGLSPGNDNNEPDDGGDSVNGNGLLPNGGGNKSGHGSINVNGLSPGGDDSKPGDNNININGLSPGGDDADGHGNNGHGGLPSDDLGKPNQNNIDAHGLEPDHNHHHDHDIHKPDTSDLNDGELPSGDVSIGAHINPLPGITGHINLDGILPKPKPEPSEHIIDHGGLEPDVKPDLSGHINPTFPGDDIIPNPNDHIIPGPMPDVHGRPNDIPSIEIPGQVGNKGDDKKNNSLMIPVLLPGGGHIMVHGNALSNIPSYIIVKINGQPTLIQNPGGFGIGGGNAGSSDLNKLIIGNNGLPIGGINGGAVQPSWINLLPFGVNGGASIGGGGIGILPNMQPIWIGTQMPNIGGGGTTGGSYIIPNNEPVEPVPVPVPIPRPMPPPRPIYPFPQPIPMPEPGLNINTYPGYPWLPIWNPSNPGVNLNVTHKPLTPNQGSNDDWKILLDLLANIDSRLPQPTTPPQPEVPLPIPPPNYPSYPYPQYPYPYPPPYPYLPYPYPTNNPYHDNKPPGPGKNVTNIAEKRDPANSRPDPQPRPVVPIIPGPEPQPEPRPKPQPEPFPEPRPEPHPEPQPEPFPKPQPKPYPEPQPEPRPEPQPAPLPVPQPVPFPEPQPEPRPVPKPVPFPKPQPKPYPEPQPEPYPEPQPEPRPEPQPAPRPVPQPVPFPEPQPKPYPEPQPEPRPEPQPEPRPEPQPEPLPEPLPEPRPEPQPEPRPEPQPEPRPEPQPELRPVPLDPNNDDVPRQPHPGGPFEPRPETQPEPRPQPDHHHHHDRPVINLPNIQITLPKPTHNGKPKPGHPELDSGLIDILNVLLKFPDRNSHPPKNIEPLIKLLLAILKPGDNLPLIPNLNEEIKGQPDLGNLGHLLVHLLDGRKEPNLNVLVEPGMDEGTRANLILLLQLLANNLGGSSSYPSVGYYQPENPLLYFLGHFPCDHPNIQALSGMQSNSNLWQLLAKMYGHNYGQELRLERSAEEADDKPPEAEQKTETN